MKILVTGGRGFIGSHLIPVLKKNGHTVRSYDIKDGKDILDMDKLDKALKWCDVVYHLAALTDVQESFIKPLKYIEANITGTTYIIYTCSYFKKKIIYTSTAAIYDAFSSPYALSKNIADRSLETCDFPFVILRLFNVYGEGMNKTTMLSRFQKEDPIIIYGDGKQTRDFIHIDDVVKILIDALKSKWNGFIGDVGTGKSRTVLSIAKQFKKSIQFSTTRKEVKYSVANTKKFTKLYTKPLKSLNSWIDKYR